MWALQRWLQVLKKGMTLLMANDGLCFVLVGELEQLPLEPWVFEAGLAFVASLAVAVEAWARS